MRQCGFWGGMRRSSRGAVLAAALCVAAVVGPSAAIGLPAGARFATIDVGYNHSCGLTPAGVAYCWGENSSGQLGDSHAGVDSSYPSQVVFPTGVTKFKAISAGYYETCAISVAGAGYCWGYNEYGQLGDGSNADADEPQPVAGLTFASIDAGSNTTCGITTDGDAYCWGFNDYGQLGNNQHDETESGLADENTPQLVAGGLKFKSVSVGDNTTCGVTTRGKGYCWGTGNNGELGNGDYSVEDGGEGLDADSAVPVAVATSQRFSTIRTSSEHSCGLTLSGVVYCWGDRTYGQIGNGDDSSGFVAVPTQVSLPVRAKGVFGADTGWSSCAIDSSGRARCWGWNAGFDYEYSPGLYENVSILGTGSHMYQEALPDLVMGGLKFSTMDIDYYHGCGLTTKGVAYCWGWGFDGQLGTGFSEATYGPVLPVTWEP